MQQCAPRSARSETVHSRKLALFGSAHTAAHGGSIYTNGGGARGVSLTVSRDIEARTAARKNAIKLS